MFKISISLLSLLCLFYLNISSAHVLQSQTQNEEKRQLGIIIIPTNNNKNISTNNSIKAVMKFPPFFEYIVQAIQKYFSNYVHEDLSRPPPFGSPNFDGNSLLLSTKPDDKQASHQIMVNITISKIENNTKNSSQSAISKYETSDESFKKTIKTSEK